MKRLTYVVVALMLCLIETQAQHTCASALPLQLNSTCIDENNPGGNANSGDPIFDLVDNNVCSSTFSTGEDYIYQYTPIEVGELKLELFSADNLLGIMVTEGCPTTGNCVAFKNTSTANYLELRTCELAAAVTYYIHFSRSANNVGQFCMNAAFVPPNPGSCATALPLQMDESCVMFDSPGINAGDPSECDNTAGNACASTGYIAGDDYIYSYTPTEDGELFLDLFTNTNLLGMFVTEGCPLTGTCIASGTTSSPSDLSVRTCALASGITYYIHITRNNTSDLGQFCLNARYEEPNPSTCATAKTLTIDNNCATFDSGAANSGDPSGCNQTTGNACSTSFNVGDDYIYTYTPAVDGELLLELFTDANVLGLFVTEGCPETGTCVAFETTASTSETAVRTCFVEAGLTYYVHITRNTTAPLGEFCLNARFEEPHPGTCERAKELAMDFSCVSWDSNGLNTGNTLGCDETDNNLCNVGFSNGDDYIYQITPFQDTELLLNFHYEFNLGGIHVTEGCPETGICIATETVSTQTSGALIAQLEMDKTYYIQISRSNNGGGGFCLNAQTNPMVPTSGTWGLLCLVLGSLIIGTIVLFERKLEWKIATSA